MTEEETGRTRKGQPLSCHARKVSFCHARRFLSGIQCLFSSPSSGTPWHARPPWISSEDGFPLKTCGNDRKGGRREGREGELAGIHPTDEEFLGFEAPGTWIRFSVQGNWNVSPPGRTLPLGLLRRPIHFHPPATIEARNAIPGFSTGIRERGKHDGSPIIRTDGLKVQKMFIHHRL